MKTVDLIAKLPYVATKICRNLCWESSSIKATDSPLNLSLSFTNVLGFIDAQLTERMHLHLTLDSDHEGGHEVPAPATGWAVPFQTLPCPSWQPWSAWQSSGADWRIRKCSFGRCSQRRTLAKLCQMRSYETAAGNTRLSTGCPRLCPMRYGGRLIRGVCGSESLC